MDANLTGSGVEAPPARITGVPRAIRIALLAGAIVAAAALLLAFHWRAGTTRAVEEAATASIATTGRLPQLAAHLEKHPRDARAWAIYARLKFSGGDYAEAAAAYARAVELPGKVALDPLVWCEYADALAMAGDGRLAGRPRELIDHALALNRRHPRALEMAGSAEIEAGDYAAALRHWEELLSVLPPDTPARAELAQAVERTRLRAGR